MHEYGIGTLLFNVLGGDTNHRAFLWITLPLIGLDGNSFLSFQTSVSDVLFQFFVACGDNRNHLCGD